MKQKTKLKVKASGREGAGVICTAPRTEDGKKRGARLQGSSGAQAWTAEAEEHWGRTAADLPGALVTSVLNQLGCCGRTL